MQKSSLEQSINEKIRLAKNLVFLFEEKVEVFRVITVYIFYVKFFCILRKLIIIDNISFLDNFYFIFLNFTFCTNPIHFFFSFFFFTPNKVYTFYYFNRLIIDYAMKNEHWSA